MTRCLPRFLAAALAATAFLGSSVSQSDPGTGANSRLVAVTMVGDNEQFEAMVVLGDSIASFFHETAPEAQCHASFTFVIPARPALGIPRIEEPVELAAGESHIFTENSVPSTPGPVPVVAEIHGFHRTGACQLLSAYRVADRLTGATRAVLEPEPGHGTSDVGALLVRGGFDESIRLMFVLNRREAPSTSTSLFPSEDCKASVTVEATDPAGVAAPESQSIDLTEGQWGVFSFLTRRTLPGDDAVVIEVRDLEKTGDCDLLTSAAVVGPDNDTRAPYADRARFSEVVLATTPYKTAGEQ